MSITANSDNIFINNANLKIAKPGKGLIFPDGSILNTAPPNSDSTNTAYFSNSINAFIITETTANTGFAGNTAPADAISVSSNLFISYTGNLRTLGVITGDGSGLTDLNASNLASGTINNVRLPDIISKTDIYGDAGVFNAVGTSVIVSAGILGGSPVVLAPSTLKYKSNTHTFTNFADSSTYATLNSNNFTINNGLRINSASFDIEWNAVINRIQSLDPWKIGGALFSPPTGSGVVPLTAIPATSTDVMILYESGGTPVFQVAETFTTCYKSLFINNGNGIDWYDPGGGLVTRDFGSTVFHNTGRIIKLQGNDYTIDAESGGDIRIGGLSHYLFYDHSAQAIGIGTNTPYAKLHIRDTDNLDAADNASIPNYQFMIETSSGGVVGEEIGMGFINFGGTPGATETPGAAITFERTGNFSKGKLHFKTKTNIDSGGSCDTHMTISDNGNVGIGTTSPDRKLNVGSGGVNLNHTSSYYLMDAADIYEKSTDLFKRAANHIFQNEAGSEWMRLTNGNVGIGETNPQYKLQVNGNSACSDSFRVSKVDSPAIEWCRGATNRTNAWGSTAFADFRGISTQGNLIFQSAFNGATTETLVISYLGRVGIGTASPSYTLDVAGVASCSTLKVTGGTGLSYQAGTIYTDPNWGMLFRGQGNQQLAEFRWDNAAGVERMRMKNGNLGIGKTDPRARLEVATGSNDTTYNQTRYFRYNTAITYDPSDFFGQVSIFADDDIVSKQHIVSHNGTMSASDSRIKENIEDISDTEALDTLRLLKPKTYTYKDTLRRGSEKVIGFIAQEVQEILPQATGKRYDTIPNIYEIANVSASNVITFTNFNTSNLNANSTVLNIRTVTNGDERITVANVIDEHTIQVVEDLSKFTGSVDDNGNVITETITTTYTQEEYDALESKNGINITYTPEITKDDYEALTDEEKEVYTLSYSKTETVNVGVQIFVYGQEVDDFNFLKKESIFTIATAALQEVDRQQQADKERIATLESQVVALLARVEALENSNP